ncbi:hypothetical protein EDF64_10766 [Curtobacterium flaccumfaciens]|uniref:Uncharacterized protein n=1 Tax=Curtobacterium flaccumfaciens TaxID=2035 RepID=A0A4R6DHP8_9MICO|nr:hypothetical protein [Curtobacterium flaccumfaciens]TDN43639.1 hypothetical protein EDF64_10766 [Curtobacterium flaccumfaciens]
MVTTGVVASGRRTGWRSPGWAALYWVTVALGVVGGGGSWLWLYLASEESTRGATPDRTGANPGIPLGVTGLVIGHVVGVGLLLVTARLARRRSRSAVAFAALGLVVGSGIGLALSLQLTDGLLVAPWPHASYTP